MSSSLTAPSRRPGRRPSGSVVAVAVDGTGAGLRAVRWAAHEAAVRGDSLTIVHAAPYAAGSTGSLRAHASRILARAFTVARQLEAGLQIRTQLMDTDPRTALVAVSRNAALLVLGLAGAGTAQDSVVGSLALDVAGRGEGPVAVVRRAGNPSGPVVAAVGDPHTDAETLRQAHQAALRHGAVLDVVHAARSAGEAAEVHDALDSLLRRWAEHRSPVPSAVHVVRERPVEALLASSRAARLLVVGPGAGRRHLLGSTGRATIRLADCPVLVAVPPRPSGPAVRR